MRPDQREKLAALSEKLADVAIEECDPDNWPGAGVHVTEHTVQQRGDRFWHKKNAAATLGLLVRVEELSEKDGNVRGREASVREIDKDIARAEKLGEAIIERMNAARTPH